MKNIAIFGASRAGKTTLARNINKVYSNYHIINGDSIRSTFEKALPQNNINKYNGSGMKEDFARFSATFFKDEIKRNKGYYNYIFDSCDISVENALKFFNDDNIIILFLGYTELTEQEALNNYRKYEKKDDWTSKRTDEDLIEHAKIWINNSKIFKSDCSINKIDYIDTSYSRDKILKNIEDKLLKEIIK